MDEEAQNKLIALKTQKIASILPESNLHNFSVLWRYESGVDKNQHCEYIEDLVTRFQVRVFKDIGGDLAFNLMLHLAILVYFPCT